MFQHAIVKIPCKAMINGITDHPELGVPDYEKALAQHAAYIEALKKCGVDVTVLPPDEAYPDSCFVEDPAIVTKYCAIVTNPGAASRKGETAAIAPVLEQFYPKDKIFHITDPGTLEGGDVMMCGDTFYVGQSARTNAEGIRQLGEILGQFGCKVVAVPLTEVLHLKTGVVYLENNCIWMNGTVIVPAGYPTVQAAVESLGYPVLVCDTSEFRKIDGGLSCLSLRF
ncbi:dimethylarginine dimethylaminohydrolase family protein [uncultured Ruthenibacterium sp.]|uniref:dimethylarginine dimethylaminohydrolase family protein n=1 Tax=uncultured Ruthenibacterium sp. TaxID=1905347 RepID=UPI00349EF2B0